MAYQDTQKYIHLKNKDNASTIDSLGDSKVNGTYYLTDNPKHYEIQRSNNFVFYVSGLSKAFSIVGNKYAQDNADDVIKVSVTTSSIPHFTQSVIQVKRGNNTMKFAGNPEFGSGNIELNDWIGAGTKDILYAWQQKSYNVQTEKVGLATDYKKDAYLLEYTPDGQLIRTWKLMGCWISALSEGNFNSESNEKHTIQATIEYDKAWIDTSDIDD